MSERERSFETLPGFEFFCRRTTKGLALWQRSLDSGQEALVQTIATPHIPAIRAALLSDAPTVEIRDGGSVGLVTDRDDWPTTPGTYKLVAVPVEEETDDGE